MKTGKSFDYDQALSDPCRIFDEPDNVLLHPDLDATQKREILESWWQDAVRLSKSEGENIGGNEPMLKRVWQQEARVALARKLAVLMHQGLDGWHRVPLVQGGRHRLTAT